MPSLKRSASHLLKNASHLVNVCGGITCDGCPGYAIPETLTVSITGCDDNCADTSFNIVYNSGTSKWEGTAAYGSCGKDITYKLSCSGSDFRAEVTMSDACGTIDIASSATCDPFAFSHSTALDFPCCPTSGDVSFTVTE